MSNTAFAQVTYPLDTLVNNIAMGQIGLPDIQRPFVWPNTKVRDLFDSMYRGYPVGYLLFWANGSISGHRTIGPDGKQLSPNLVIVDGQQRLTSLYAVIKGVPIVRSNYKREAIRIAFNPIEEKFEVTSAAIERDRSFIPDISRLWSADTTLFQVVEEFLGGLRSSSRGVADEEVKGIQDAIVKLQGLGGFPFTALQLSADITEEAVAEVFVRINSQGKTLNQADFILTLMSVFWDAGRTELERFCRESRVPSQGRASSYNHFIEPSPDQLLRVGVGLAFKRARLEHVYSLLRGKDLETGEFSDERRDKQFDVLKQAQSKALNLQYWHDFMQCLRHAGFRAQRMIASQNALLYTYTLYLIGRTELNIDERTLRQVVAQWFFMATITGRYTGGESTMESDLAMFRGVHTGDQFISRLRQACSVSLTSDFWEVTLPNELATSSARSPSLFAFEAALVLLDAPVLFSNFSVAEMLDPASQGGHRSIERHHLFPRGYLAKIRITETRDINQIANYTYLEWIDNVQVSDLPPAEYLPELKERFGNAELAQMYRLHALPEGWEAMAYWEFLEKRRDLMAKIIREGYDRLTSGPKESETVDVLDLESLVSGGESDMVEFKSTLRVNRHTGQRDPRMEHAILRTLAGFLNAHGGTLVVGVADDGTPVGLDSDQFDNEDKMGLHLTNIVNRSMGPDTWGMLHLNFDDYEDDRVLVVRCEKSPSPVYVKDQSEEYFYIRTGHSTTELSVSQTQDYIGKRFS